MCELHVFKQKYVNFLHLSKNDNSSLFPFSAHSKYLSTNGFFVSSGPVLLLILITLTDLIKEILPCYNVCSFNLVLTIFTCCDTACTCIWQKMCISTIKRWIDVYLWVFIYKITQWKIPNFCTVLIYTPFSVLVFCPKHINIISRLDNNWSRPKWRLN